MGATAQPSADPTAWLLRAVRTSLSDAVQGPFRADVAGRVYLVATDGVALAAALDTADVVAIGDNPAARATRLVLGAPATASRVLPVAAVAAWLSGQVFRGACDECAGAGHAEHGCDHCDHICRAPCRTCGGTGLGDGYGARFAEVPARVVGGVDVDARRLRPLLAAMPGPTEPATWDAAVAEDVPFLRVAAGRSVVVLAGLDPKRAASRRDVPAYPEDRA